MTSRAPIFSALLVAAALLLVDAVPAEATTCNAACSQIRRACVHSSQSARKVARHACETGLDACVAACDADPLVCPDVSCDECKATCETDRIACVDDAKATREATKAICESTRQDCRNVCVDPVDRACVRECKREAQHDCARPARKAEVACKRACENDDGKRKCIRQCRREKNAALELCTDAEAFCVGSCIGVVPVLDPPPPAPPGS